ncbi:MAG: aldo/keto reductase [Planctomycetota bacterium]
MEHVRLPHTDLTITRVGLGGCPLGGHGWGPVEHDRLVAAVHAALDSGVNHFDTADIYGLGASEQLLAEALGRHRHETVIASKFGVRRSDDGTFYDARPEWLGEALDATLRRLRIETLPLYYLHWPDGQTPIAETLGALQRLKDAGKIRAIGVSNLSPDQLDEACGAAEVSLVQLQYSLLDREDAASAQPVAERHGVPLATWGSLAQGLLTGKFDASTRFAADDRRRRYPAFQGERFQRNLRFVALLRSEATALGTTPGRLAIRWLLDTPGVGAVLFGAKSPEQVEDNVAAQALGPLPAEVYQRLSRGFRPQAEAA